MRCACAIPHTLQYQYGDAAFSLPPALVQRWLVDVQALDKRGRLLLRDDEGVSVNVQVGVFGRVCECVYLRVRARMCVFMCARACVFSV